MKKPIMKVYRDALTNAQYWRDKAKEAKTERDTELCETVAHELYHVVADMENTEEINPIVCKACGEPMYTTVRAHHHTDDKTGQDITV